jgi:hypothetical protein
VTEVIAEGRNISARSAFSSFGSYFCSLRANMECGSTCRLVGGDSL